MTLFMIVVLINRKISWIYLHTIKMLFVYVHVYQTQRHSVLSPSSSYFTKLLTLYPHDKVCYAGIEPTIPELQLKYWIIKGRKTVWKIINPCMTCKNVSLALYLLDRYPKSSDVNKCFILIFTSVASQFTYLNLSPDMNSVSFINCFKAFINRGTPTKIVSDNFKSFERNWSLL